MIQTMLAAIPSPPQGVWYVGPLAVRAYAIHLCRGSTDRADDLVQETFLRAWRHITKIDEARGSVRGWLLATLRNARIDLWRRTAREQVTDAPPDPVVDAGDDEVVVAHVMEQALLRLSENHRTVLRKTYYTGLSVAEAAHELGIAPGTVKSTVARGLSKLRADAELRAEATS